VILLLTSFPLHSCLNGQTTILLATLVPVFGSFFLPWIGWISIRLRNLLALFLVLTPLVIAFEMLPGALAGNSCGSISHYENQNEYYFAVLFLRSMMGILFSASLIYLFVYREMTAERFLRATSSHKLRVVLSAPYPLRRCNEANNFFPGT